MRMLISENSETQNTIRVLYIGRCLNYLQHD